MRNMKMATWEYTFPMDGPSKEEQKKSSRKSGCPIVNTFFFLSSFLLNVDLAIGLSWSKSI